MAETNMAFMPLGHNTNFTVFSVIKNTDSISAGGKIIMFFRKRIVAILIPNYSYNNKNLCKLSSIIIFS